MICIPSLARVLGAEGCWCGIASRHTMFWLMLAFNNGCGGNYLRSVVGEWGVIHPIRGATVVECDQSTVFFHDALLYIHSPNLLQVAMDYAEYQFLSFRWAQAGQEE